MGAETRSERPAGVVLLDPDRNSLAGEVLSRAFAEDPLWSALMPDLSLRSRMFVGAIRMVAAGGGTIETTPMVEAAALWMPPGRELDFAAFVKSGFAPLRWVVRTPWRDLKRMMALQRRIQVQRSELMPEPHWRLEVLGVDPDHQGRGLGSLLVEAGLRRADDAGMPCYVDTSAEQNVGFYERLGFELEATMTVTDLGLPFWMMSRPPRANRP